jgi:hypothetical protein
VPLSLEVAFVLTNRFEREGILMAEVFYLFAAVVSVRVLMLA